MQITLDIYSYTGIILDLAYSDPSSNLLSAPSTMTVPPFTKSVQFTLQTRENFALGDGTVVAKINGSLVATIGRI